MHSILDQDIMYLPGVGPRKKEILSKELNINTFGDLLEYYPYKYVDRTQIYRIAQLQGDMPYVQLKGRILSFEEFDMGPRRKRLIAHFSDGWNVADLVWFQGTKYILNTYKVGVDYIVFGKPSMYGGRFQIAHPDIDEVTELKLTEMGMQPHYGTSERMKKAGITSRTMEKLTKGLLEQMQAPLTETLPPFITNALHLASRDEAMRGVHYPHNNDELQRAQMRLKFEELFYVQLNILRYANYHRRKYRGYNFSKIGQYFNDFYHNNLPFELTGAQKRVMHEIRNDMDSGRQMNRLVQGDVGSGKTLVALMAMLIAVDNGFQACLMAPTEILAEQHLATVLQMLKGTGVTAELLTGIVKGKRRTDVLQRLASGELHILVGTHALLEDNVQFANLGLAVVDEQHRFGVKQRAKLWAKNDNPPHVLVMTATPIPRTLAMTIYGDLDVSVIDELPPGRKPIQTLHKYDNQTTSLYAGIRQQVNLGRQVYIVYPLIEESEKTDLKNLEEGYAALTEIFPEYKLSKIHGRMKSKEKEAEMARFANGETQILVATTVIEVGVNVPNASVMVILDAQRFGLSQLHQLRGRVGRGADQSYCILVTNRALSAETRKRIDIMCETNDGFRIAEADLKLRGPGDLEGTQQSDPDCNLPEHAMLWNRLKELRKTNIDWAAIS